MVGISGYSPNTIGTLFSSLGRYRSSNNSTSLGALATRISDYNMIRNGSYKKLMTAYFARTDTKASQGSSNSSKANSASRDSAGALGKVKGAAKELEDSASRLLKTGKDSVFNKVSRKAEDGTAAEEYDTDKIYKAVKAFVDDYNDAVKAAGRSNTASVERAAVNMANSTAGFQKALSEVGITIDSENSQLSIDEGKFKGADMDRVKNLFNGPGSFANNVKLQSSMIGFRAGNEAAKANTYTYTRYGGYDSAYASGAMLDGFY